MEKKVSVSFLSSKNEKKDLIKLNRTSADYIHVDVMDGHFVRKRNKPFKRLYKMSNVISKRLDVHLMEKKPYKNINNFALLNTEYITIHVEIEEDILKDLELIKSYSIKCGLAINPDTKINSLIPYLPYIDMVLVMSVFPGEGGQEFITDTEDRLKEVKELLNTYNIPAVISVDGGVNDKTKDKCKYADMLVSGSYVVKGDNFQEKITSLR